MNIHKTAILDKSVSLGKNVEIGAFSQILGNVKIGDNVKIKSNCVIGAEADQPRVDRLGDQNGSIVIQDGCVIKDSVIISKPTLTELTKIGSNSYLMSGAYIAHDSVLGKNVIISHGARLSGYTTVDDFSNIGANATTHQKTTIGMCVMVGANSFVKGELNSGLIYVEKNKILGINKIGIENAKLSDKEKQRIIDIANKYIN